MSKDALIASLADDLKRVGDSREALRKALRRIADWEMPESGRAWADGSPMSYSAAFGSKGEQDVIRSIARSALES